MLPTLIARRYLFSPQSRSVVNLISGLSVAAVAMPVAAMIVLLSVFNGFETLVRSMYSTFDADLTLSPREGQTFRAADLDTAALRRIEGVEALSLVLEQRALLVRDDRQTTAVVRGVDDGYGEVFDLEPTIVSGEWTVRTGDLEHAVAGMAMARTLGIRSLADADVEIYALRRGGFSSLLPFENYTRRSVPVGGVFALDLETEQTYLVTSLRLVRELFGHPDRASSLVVRLDPAADASQAAARAARIAGEGFRVRTREELRASFYRIMNYEKWGIFFISLLVLAIASFSVVGALTMLIVEKRRDAATLRALGATGRFVRAVFRREGLLICALGALLGTLLGVGAVLVQQHFGLIEIPAETFLTQSYPVEFRAGDLAAVLAAFAALALLLSDITVRSMIKNES